MKKTLNLLTIIFATTLPLSALSQTTFFSDNFTNGSTLNSATPVAPTTNSTSYEFIGSSTLNTASGITAHDLQFGTGNQGGGNIAEIQALFATNAIALTQIGDFIRLTVVFTNTMGIYSAGANAVSFGLYNSGQVLPLAGGLNGIEGNAATASGGAQNWIGYMEEVATSSNPNYRLYTRPAQAETSNNNQDLTSNGSSTKSFTGQATVATSATFVNASTNQVYTDVFTITLNGANSLAITNQLYTNSSVAIGTPATTLGGIVTNANFLTGGFDALAVGFQKKTDASISNVMDIASISVAGSVTVISGPPTITLQPTPIVVATGGAGAFQVSATGFNVTYQWHRNGTNLTDGGNISGSTTPTLSVSSVGAGDVLSGANGYWVAVTGSGPFTTNSITNSLSLITSTNLIWSGGASTWDVNNTVAWLDTNGNPSVFNYGDPVTFDNTAGSIHTVSLVGSFLSAASVTVNATYKLIFSAGTGSFAGPGILLDENSGQLDIKNANTYTGGTIISNSAAFVFLENNGGLGTGPLTLAKAGGSMEIAQVGTASSGINGNVNVADDFSIQFDGAGTFSGVILGNLSGTVGKTLSFEPTPDNTSPFTNSRVRIYGTNTVYNANLFVDGPATSQAQYSGVVMAPYNSIGVQTYNGVISGNGGLIQRGSATTILAGPNTYSGGTTPTDGSIGFGINTVGSVTSGPIGTGPLNLAPEVPNLTASGTVFASGGARTIANPIQYPSGTNNLLFIIAGTNDLTFTGTYILSGVDALGTPTNRTIQVNNTNGLTTISGVISDLTNGVSAGFGFIKAGVGKLAFGNTETYTGPTAIGGGTLAVNGTLNAASSVTATNGGLLGGTGTVNGAVTIGQGGGVSPGNSIGTLTINNNLTIKGGSTNVFEVNKQASTKDLAVVNGNITYGGTLFATNLAGTITSSDTFQIFNVSGTKTGNFTNIIGSPGSGMAWTFNTNNGTLGVVVTINPNPPVIQVSATGSQLNLSWPTNLGWHLLMQTNSLSVGLSTNWQEVVGATLVTSTNFQATNNGAVFFKMTN